MIGYADALRRLLDVVEPLDIETVDLEQVGGRVLAAPIVADRDFPPTDRSAMDGFAVRGADLVSAPAHLAVVGEVRAGEPAGSTRLDAGQAVKIFTGAVVPPGADTVIMVEDTEEDRGTGQVRIDRVPRPGQHIRRRGTDLAAGGSVLRPGQPIQPPEIAALASVGATRIPVHRCPRVAVLSTGDELVPPDAVPAAHQIRNSNGATLAALLREMRIEPELLGIAGDEAGTLDRLLAAGLNADLLLVSGGVSVGEYDLVGDALARAGMTTLFHGVAIKPGKPILAGRREGCTVLGLPGNPVSALAGFLLFAAPVLRRLLGHAQPVEPELDAILDEPIRCRPGRRTYHLARLEWRQGALHGRRIRSTGSGDVLSTARANGFLVTGEQDQAVDVGARLPALLWPGGLLRP